MDTTCLVPCAAFTTDLFSEEANCVLASRYTTQEQGELASVNGAVMEGFCAVERPNTNLQA